MMNERKSGEEEPIAASSEGESEPAVELTPEERIRELEEELRIKSEEALVNREKYLREAADSENLKKRMQREKADSIRYANENLVVDLLPVVDNLELALGHASDDSDRKSVIEGVQMVLRLFHDILERNGVTSIEAVAGVVADWNLHDACGTEERPDLPQNSIISLTQKGYRLNDRVLRPAQVIVARAPATSPTDGETTEK
jgi:molecular chaperone GrpE